MCNRPPWTTGSSNALVFDSPSPEPTAKKHKQTAVAPVRRLIPAWTPSIPDSECGVAAFGPILGNRLPSRGPPPKQRPRPRSAPLVSLCGLAPVLTLTAWLQPTYKVKMPAGGWKKLKAPQLRAACEERKIAVKPKEKPAAMVKKLAAFKG